MDGQILPNEKTAAAAPHATDQRERHRHELGSGLVMRQAIAATDGLSGPIWA